MAMLIHMPAEIISKILEYKNITIKDIVNFSSTSKQFRYVINDNNLWRKKFSQRWPTATQNYERKMGKSFYNANISDVQAAVKCATELWNFVSDMSKRHYYYSDDHKYLNDFSSLFTQCLDTMHCIFLKDELIKTIYTSPEQCDLTRRYYSIKLFQCWIKHYTERKLKKFEENQLMEELLTIIMQLCQPEKYISYLHIDKFIDNIVQEVLKCLREEYPRHKIFSISPEQLSIWKCNNIKESYWEESEAKQIQCILHKIILNFDSYNLNYPWKSEIEESYFYELQYRKSLWLTIYCCVARRLGIHMELSIHYECQSDNLIHVAWKPRNHIEYKEYFIIDWMYDKSNLKISLMNKCHLMPNPKKIYLRQLIEVLEKDFENDIPAQLSFSRLTYEYINSDVRKCTPLAEKHWKRRLQKIKFAVGMVVAHRHRGRQENQAGVIIGWHVKFQPEWFSFCSCWIHYERDRRNHSQPYYIILMDHNVMCYVPQSFITSVCMARLIYNTEIGRYFCKIKNTHYVPNQILAKQYPRDAAIIRRNIYNY